ncbi:restriction endonuclease subunit S [Pseudoalteromonas marina]|uniref:restriction endonuclease subunit S n=1 Tax=Pseudoalteromonas marina TaxID=267375 RepID=UPI0023F4631F|nr:restriction endonuclease subunit S [Pseudoalteromonas marina]
MNAKMRQATEELRLSDIADIRLGHPFRGTVKQYDKGDVHVVQVRNTEPTGEINKTTLVQTQLSTKKQPDWLKNGDVLFVAKGAKHYSALVQQVLERTVCSPHFFVVRIKAEFKDMILPDFLCWQLNQQPAQRYFKATAEGSMYLSIRRQVLENVPIKVLTYEKQKELTAMHRCAVKEQKVLHKLIENRQQQLEAIAMHALESVD